MLVLSAVCVSTENGKWLGRLDSLTLPQLDRRMRLVLEFVFIVYMYMKHMQMVRTQVLKLEKKNKNQRIFVEALKMHTVSLDAFHRTVNKCTFSFLTPDVGV